MAFESELSALYGQLSKTTTEVPVTVPIETAQVPVVQPPVEVPKVDIPAVAQVPVIEAPVKLDGIVEDWDTQAPKAETTVTIPEFDFAALAKELGVTEVKTKEELIAKVSEIKAKATTAPQEPTVLPQDLAKAVEIAKQGGNYLEYLKVAAVDWSKEDPVILFENWVYDRFAKGGKTSEQIDEYLGKIDEFDKEVRGIELQNQYIAYQNQQRIIIENQARLEKQERDATARRTLDSMNDIYGFKLSGTNKEELFSDFTTPAGQALLAQAGGNYKKALEGLFTFKYGAKIDQFRKKQLHDLTKRELLNELQNPKITSPSEIANAAVIEKDPIKLYLSELSQKQGL